MSHAPRADSTTLLQLRASRAKVEQLKAQVEQLQQGSQKVVEMYSELVVAMMKGKGAECVTKHLKMAVDTLSVEDIEEAIEANSQLGEQP